MSPSDCPAGQRERVSCRYISRLMSPAGKTCWKEAQALQQGQHLFGYQTLLFLELQLLDLPWPIHASQRDCLCVFDEICGASGGTSVDIDDFLEGLLWIKRPVSSVDVLTVDSGMIF